MDSTIEIPEIFTKPNNAYFTYDEELSHYFTPSNNQFFPLWFEKHPSYESKNLKTPTKYFFPFEPMINISVRKGIAKRYVAKGSKLIGSIMEQFSIDAFTIQIVGTVQDLEIHGNPKPQDCFPIKDMIILQDYFQNYPRIKVYNQLFQILGINEITIESIEFPFTKGENVLGYVINAVSNYDFNLLNIKSRGQILVDRDLNYEIISDSEIEEIILDEAQNEDSDTKSAISLISKSKR
jgi:hypothetical protein